jgi:transcriptional regulator with XRE-family HTH domain
VKKKAHFGVTDNVGERLREWRKKSKLKLLELASVIKISQGSLSDLENNKSLPSANTLASIHTHTNLNIIWLLTETGKMKRPKKN